MKSIDIYLIAGQSNAAGYTKYADDLLTGLWPDCQIGSPQVLYAGRAEHTLNVNTPQVATNANEFQTWTPARAGMGWSSQHIGPEVGMAAYLSRHYYNAKNKDKTAGILKFAHGGTSLLNNLSGENAATGNWVPPSYAAELGVPYTGLTGGCYRALLAQIEIGLAALRADDYGDINFKGLFWMQGESDRGNPTEYERAFAHLVRDLRADIGRITGKDASDFAIMVGEISETSGSAKADAVAFNQRFIQMQRALAQPADHIYTVASGQFKINQLDENGNDKNGQDAWHWVTADAFAIGELVGRCIVENLLAAK